MSQDNDYVGFYFTLRTGIDKLFRSIDKATLKEIKNILRDNNLEIKDCYTHPDILCKILRKVYGRSYTQIIEEI
jgi:hypothetical protein